MSSDLSKKVRYNRKVEDEEWEEPEVVIYESTDIIGDDHADIQSHKGGPLTEKHPPAVQTRPFRTAALCLGVLCFLMIIGIIFLSVQYISVTLGKDELETRYDQLETRYDQLETRYDQLETRYDQLSHNNSQLQEKVSGKRCPEGWKRFGCSCYFKSNEMDNWGSSREYCQKRGADLVVINNKEEQEFVIQLNINEESWIGLREIKENWIRGKWEWVDGSPLSETFWASRSYHSDQRAATCCNQQGQCTQSISYTYKNWICEK